MEMPEPAAPLKLAVSGGRADFVSM